MINHLLHDPNDLPYMTKVSVADWSARRRLMYEFNV